MVDAGSIELEVWSPNLMVARFFGVPSDERIQEYLDWMTSGLRAARGTALILDATHSSLSHPGFIRRQASWIKQHRQLIVDRSYGTALVLDGAVLRFTLSSILLVAPSPAPMLVHSRLEESLGWAKSVLKERGHAMPPEPFRLRPTA